MQEEETKKVLRDIILSLSNTDSFSGNLLFLRNKNANYLEIIRKNSFAIAMTASITEGSFCDSLGITTGDQRIRFIDLASKMNAQVLKRSDQAKIIDKLNSVWTKNNINLTTRKDTFDTTINAIEKIILLEKSKKIIRVIECWDEFLEILPYCSRYIHMQEKDVAEEVSNLIYAYTDLKVLIINEKDAKKRAIEALTKAGHPKDTLDTKRAGVLMTIIERMIEAGNAVMQCKKINPKVVPSKGDLMDQIAIYWLSEEEKIQENTTDFIIPLPEQ